MRLSTNRTNRRHDVAIVRHRVQRARRQRDAAVQLVRAHALAVYALAALLKKRWGVQGSLYEFLQILSVTLFEKTLITALFSGIDSQVSRGDTGNQLILFGD